MYTVVRQPLRSLGAGLPLSRLTLRVFGGDLDISNNNNGGEGDGGIGGGNKATLTIRRSVMMASEVKNGDRVAFISAVQH